MVVSRHLADRCGALLLQVVREHIKSPTEFDSTPKCTELLQVSCQPGLLGLLRVILCRQAYRLYRSVAERGGRCRVGCRIFTCAWWGGTASLCGRTRR
jgi:hypothetical protein